MQKNVYQVVGNIWLQNWYFVWKIVYKMHNKLMGKGHMENAILGKTLTLVPLTSYFMFSPPKWTNNHEHSSLDGCKLNKIFSHWVPIP